MLSTRILDEIVHTPMKIRLGRSEKPGSASADGPTRATTVGRSPIFDSK
jgi:hypothetical protein